MIKSRSQKLSAIGLLITIGIIFGDIGTSPLYVFPGIIGEKVITEDLIFGTLSCVFWTLTIITTIKYIVITLRADNNGEGGNLTLYALVRHTKKWLHIPAIIGGAALLADGLITPPISVSSAIEGLQQKYPQYDIPVMSIVISILSALFFIQQFGTKIIGKIFGPAMIIWFSTLLVLGIHYIVKDVSVLKALNPWYAINLLVDYPDGFWLLGGVFLCTTGAEALYLDLGHCGRDNIRAAWTFVKFALLCNYFGQAVWLIEHEGQTLAEIGKTPFYGLMPEWFLLPGIVIATIATVIASQALITGTFTLVSEAMRLNFWPRIRIKYPSDAKGQVYVPSINWLLYFGCIAIVLIFQKASNMEAAYGLTINLDMIATTILVTHFFVKNRIQKGWVWFFLIFYLFLEMCFLISNMNKFLKGGYVTLLVCLAIIFVMFVWFKAAQIKKRFLNFIKMREQIPLLSDISNDETINRFSTHLVYLTGSDNPKYIESKIIYSIINKSPKRADVYWFLHINVTDEPYTKEFKITQYLKGKIIRVDFNLGFRMEQRINQLFRIAIDDMVTKGEIDMLSHYESLKKNKVMADFKFVVIDRILNDNELPPYEEFIIDTYAAFKVFGVNESKAYGLDTSSLVVEKVPLLVNQKKRFELTRLEDSNL
jgi:KUP system potassium uptake protein